MQLKTAVAMLLKQSVIPKERLQIDLKELNQLLKRFDLACVLLDDCYCLFNTASDCSVGYPPQQLEYFKSTVKTIILQQDYCVPVSSLDAAMLALFVRDHWLAVDEDKVFLGLKSRLELSSYLQQYDLCECALCQDLVVARHLVCACSVRIHAKCAARIAECPACHVQLPTSIAA